MSLDGTVSWGANASKADFMGAALGFKGAGARLGERALGEDKIGLGEGRAIIPHNVTHQGGRFEGDVGPHRAEDDKGAKVDATRTRK